MHEKRVTRACHGELFGARLSMFAVWCVLCGATGLVGVVRRLAGK